MALEKVVVELKAKEDAVAVADAVAEADVAVAEERPKKRAAKMA